MNEFVYLGGNINHNTDLPIEVNRRIRNAWCSFRKYTLGLYGLPRAPLELKTRMLRAEVLETMLYRGCVTWSPRACRCATLHRAHHSVRTRCIGWQNNNRTDHAVSCLNTPMKTASESMKAIMRRRRILFEGFMARVEDTRLPKCVMFRELRGRGLLGGPEKRVEMGCILDDLRAFDINTDQSMEAYSPGREGMAQDGGTRGGTFLGEMVRCRESQGWTMACRSMPERDGKDQGEDIAQSKRVCAASLAIID